MVDYHIIADEILDIDIRFSLLLGSKDPKISSNHPNESSPIQALMASDSMPHVFTTCDDTTMVMKTSISSAERIAVRSLLNKGTGTI